MVLPMRFSLIGGTLTLETWDDATYEEELVYHFTTSYNGQYVTLGSAGKMPQGFE